MYGELAKYYDLIYSWKDYKKDTDRIRGLISKYKESDGNELLDVGCGTGRHLEHLKDSFSCTGMDISKEMLDIARMNIGQVNFVQGDMISSDLDKKFDVIISLFSSVGHVETCENLEKTIRNLSNHLKKGGVVIIEPWFTRSLFKDGHPSMTTYDGKDIKIARLCVSKIEGNVSVLEMHFLVAERDKDVRHFVEMHKMGLFDRQKTLEFMKEAGLQAEFLETGLMEDRGLFVGVKR